MKIKLFITALIIIFCVNISDAATFKSNAETKRIPAGTKFTIKLLDPVSTENGEEGDYFSAMLIDDKKTPTNVILPAGSVIRGSVAKINKSRRFSRGAVLYLDFDHIVTPNGRQLPLDMIVCGKINLNYKGGIYIDQGYGEAIQKNWDKTVDITVNTTEKGIDTGDDILNGFGKIITVPVYAFGGAIGGGFYFLGDSIIDMFRKGSAVEFNQDTVLNVMLVNPIDVPLN